MFGLLTNWQTNITLRRMDMEKENKSCKWRDDFTWICFNGDSEKRAYSVDDDYCRECELFEEKENE